MTLSMFVLCLAFVPVAAFGLIVSFLPQPEGDVTFDWIKARYTYPETEESEMEYEKRLRG